ncbi:SOS response-associated peptidase family protein [Leptospira stimsonii]|uniref:Abasic site processing protein n=1 Tax=Leptospira stimsonii TaxID=2202203 RepID=A0ABY2N9I1_9LEPT|nr:SOS response-associated peptidase family protein [Leptospira stimsonii]TGK18857.1 hypothetical protein EHO98_12155 [Leptospira stimsonii]TGM18970.1 hypothetical protein EHQ90_05445 [Leptospira stimsonii]
MCGRYSLNASASMVVEYYNLRYETERIYREFREEKEVFPTKVEPVIQNIETNRTMLFTHWGLKNIEIKSQDRNGPPVKLKKPVINATIEKIHSYWRWSQALKAERCIIPATEYWEWSETIPKPNNRFKMYLESGDLFGFAGLNCSFFEDDGSKKIGFVIVTMPANEHVSQVHHRQPGLILKNNIEEWLDDSCKEPEKLIYHAEGQEIQFLNEMPMPVKTTIPKKNKSKKPIHPELF